MCACVCVRACMCACLRDVFAIYDNNALPRLIMIIIKIIFLYFIQIRHADDFPSTGTRLVLLTAQTHPLIFITNQTNDADSRHPALELSFPVV